MKKNQLKAGALLSYVSMGLGYLVSIIYTPLMLRLLGQSEYGLYNLVASVVAYLGVLNFGFGSTYIRYYSRYKVNKEDKKIAKLNSYYISISTAISSVFVPRVHKLVASTKDNHALSELFTRIGRVQFIILSLIATGLIFFGQSFINLWAGSNYNESYPIVLLLVLPVTIPLIQNIGIEMTVNYVFDKGIRYRK